MACGVGPSPTVHPRRPSVARTPGWALLLALAGCETPATQVVVHVSTDMELDVELDSFDLRIWAEDERREEAQYRNVPVNQAPPFSLPTSFGVAPLGGDADRRVHIELVARRLDPLTGDDTELFPTYAITSFIEQEHLGLPMFLARRCMAEFMSCEELGLTCGEEGCTDPNVRPKELTREPERGSD